MEKKEKINKKEKQFKSRKNFSNARGFAPSNFPFQGEPYRGPSPFQPGFPGMSGPIKIPHRWLPLRKTQPPEKRMPRAQDQ